MRPALAQFKELRRLSSARVRNSSVLGTLPIFLAVATMQRYLIRGISLGAVKG